MSDARCERTLGIAVRVESVRVETVDGSTVATKPLLVGSHHVIELRTLVGAEDLGCWESGKADYAKGRRSTRWAESGAMIVTSEMLNLRSMMIGT